MLGDTGGLDPSTIPDPSFLTLESEQRIHQASLGIVYNTLPKPNASGSGRSLEFRALYRRNFRGAGGQTPRARAFEFGIRLYRGIWGG